jgi:hypothetical protein
MFLSGIFESLLGVKAIMISWNLITKNGVYITDDDQRLIGLFFATRMFNYLLAGKEEENYYQIKNYITRKSKMI